MRLDTIIIFVTDLDKVLRFYTQLLKLPVLEKLPDWVLLEGGGSNIGLHRIGAAFRDDLSKEAAALRNTKVCFETNEDLEKLRSKLIAKGVHMREINTFDNYPYLLCDGEDPEGNVFQLKKPK